MRSVTMIDHSLILWFTLYGAPKRARPTLELMVFVTLTLTPHPRAQCALETLKLSLQGLEHNLKPRGAKRFDTFRVTVMLLIYFYRRVRSSGVQYDVSTWFFWFYELVHGVLCYTEITRVYICCSCTIGPNLSNLYLPVSVGLSE